MVGFRTIGAVFCDDDGAPAELQGDADGELKCATLPRNGVLVFMVNWVHGGLDDVDIARKQEGCAKKNKWRIVDGFRASLKTTIGYRWCSVICAL